jgi:hypothetical protein
MLFLVLIDLVSLLELLLYCTLSPHTIRSGEEGYVGCYWPAAYTTNATLLSFLHVYYSLSFLLRSLQNLKFDVIQKPKMINTNFVNLILQVMVSKEEPISHSVRYYCLRDLGVIRQ